MALTRTTLTQRLKSYADGQGDMTFGEACGEFVFRELIALISGLSYGKSLWLKGVSNQKKLSYYIREDGQSGITANRLLSDICEKASDWPHIFGQKTEPYFSIDAKLSEEAAATDALSDIELTLFVSFDDITVPVTLKAERIASRDIEPKEQNIAMLLDSDRAYDVPVLSPEDRAAEWLYKIFSLMELLEDTDIFYELYRLTENESMQGRRIAENFSTLATANGLRLSRSAWDIWAGYGNYAYMKKKWRKVQKRHNIKSLDWDKVHEQLSLFAKPIYDSALRGELFWGDWMPELSRYLD